MKTNPNDPINRISDIYFNGDPVEILGLTKREHFAAMAMQGFIASGATEEYTKDDIASLSAGAADALIEALNKEEQ